MKSTQSLFTKVEQIRTNVKNLKVRFEYLSKVDTSIIVNGVVPKGTDTHFLSKGYPRITDDTIRASYISNVEKDYVNLIEDMSSTLLDDKTGEFITIQKTPDVANNNITTLNDEITKIKSLFSCQNTNANYLTSYRNSKPSNGKLEALIKQLELANIGDFEKRSLTKTSLEIICWRRGLRRLYTMAPQESKEQIHADMAELDTLDIYHNNGVDRYIEIMKKYHYETVINKKNPTNFPFKKGNASNPLQYTDQGAGKPDVCLMVRDSKGEIYGSHLEPSNTPIFDVGRFEGDSLTRHRADIKKELESQGSDWNEDNINSEHIFLIDQATIAISENMNWDAKADKEQIDFVYDLLSAGLEVISKVRVAESSFRDHVKAAESKIDDLIKNKRIMISSINELRRPDLSKLGEILGKEETRVFLENLMKNQSKMNKARHSALSTAIIATMSHLIKNETLEESRETYNFVLEQIKGSNKRDEFANALLNEMSVKIEKKEDLDKNERKVSESEARADEATFRSIKMAIKYNDLEGAMMEGDIKIADLATYIRNEIDKLQTRGMDPAYQDIILCDVSIEKLNVYLKTQNNTDELQELMGVIETYSRVSKQDHVSDNAHGDDSDKKKPISFTPS